MRFGCAKIRNHHSEMKRMRFATDKWHTQLAKVELLTHALEKASKTTSNGGFSKMLITSHDRALFAIDLQSLALSEVLTNTAIKVLSKSSDETKTNNVNTTYDDDVRILGVDVSGELLVWVVEYLRMHEGRLARDPSHPLKKDFAQNITDSCDVEFAEKVITARPSPISELIQFGTHLQIRGLVKLLTARLAFDLQDMKHTRQVDAYMQSLSQRL